MAIGRDVLDMLLPLGGWIISGNNFENITWVDDRPRCTDADFNAGFAQYDAWKAEQDSKTAAVKAALLAKLGIDESDLKTLLS